jgi:hypothetical protein
MNNDILMQVALYGEEDSICRYAYLFHGVACYRVAIAEPTPCREGVMKKVHLLTMAFLAGLLLLVFESTAYSITLPIEGQVKNSAETFTGAAIVHLTGGGTLTLITNTGVTCEGDFINATFQNGSGTVTCNDGRLGTFDFVAAGFSGSGAGLIEKESFVFHIGK